MGRESTALRPSAWHNRDFRYWFGSRTVSAVGTEAGAVALPVLVYAQTGSAVLTGLLAALRVVPYLAFGLFAGAVADRFRRRPMMVGSDIVAGLAILSVPLVFLTGQLTVAVTLAATFVVWLAFVWFDAAAWGSLVRIVPRDRLPEANSVVWSAGITAGIAAPAVAGVLAIATHPTVVLAVNAACYLASALLILRIRSDLDPEAAVAESADTKLAIVNDLMEGLRFIRRTREIWVLTVAAIGLTLAGGAVLGLLVVHADQVIGFHVGDPRIGLLFTAGAIGALLASWLLPLASRLLGAGPLAGIALTCFVPSLIALAFSRGFVTAFVAWLVWHATYTLAIINGITVRQQLTPDEFQGRVNTAARMIALGGTPVGAVLGGLLAEVVGTQVTYLLAAVPVAVAAVYVWLSPVSRLRLL